MSTIEANIRIHRSEDKISSVAVLMPVWPKRSEQGNLMIDIPLLRINTIAKNEDDIETAISEAIHVFCVAAERFGQGLEKELECLRWIRVDGTTKEPELGYDAGEPDELLDRLLKTGENYLNRHLEIA